jgi:hypothetical protein
MRVQITVHSDGGGHEQCTFDSVDQGAFGLPCANVAFSAPELSFDVPMIKGSYAGKLSADGQSLSGSFTIGGMAVPVNLARQAKAITAPPPTMPVAARAIIAGERRFPAITAAPVLAIFASPHDIAPTADDDQTAAQVTAFEHAMPAAHVVRLPHANHYVFRSNEADVLREINAFVGGLAPAEAAR